jgi:hypothetical protein
MGSETSFQLRSVGRAQRKRLDVSFDAVPDSLDEAEPFFDWQGGDLSQRRAYVHDRYLSPPFVCAEDIIPDRPPAYEPE